MVGWLSLLGSFFLPCLISCVLTASLIHLAPRFGLIDDPNSRKVHTRRIPKGGGLAIYLAIAASVFVLPFGREGEAFRILALGLVIMLVGLIDDVRPLPWQLRLATHTAVAVAAVSLAPLDLTWSFRIGAIIWIVGLTNAFNMLDNMDALSAGVAWIAAGMLAIAA